MVKVLARRADAVVAGVFVRIASYSGRMDLSPQAVSLLESIAADQQKPFVTVIFGNPYTAMALPKLPAQLLTYEFSDAMETAAVRAIAGEIRDRRQAADHAARDVSVRPRLDAGGRGRRAGRPSFR